LATLLATPFPLLPLPCVPLVLLGQTSPYVPPGPPDTSAATTGPEVAGKKLAHGRSRGGRGRRRRARPGTPSTLHHPPEPRRRSPPPAGESPPDRSLRSDRTRTHIRGEKMLPYACMALGHVAHAHGPRTGPSLPFPFSFFNFSSLHLDNRLGRPNTHSHTAQPVSRPFNFV
jgi:hypothetical protein